MPAFQFFFAKYYYKNGKQVVFFTVAFCIVMKREDKRNAIQQHRSVK